MRTKIGNKKFNPDECRWVASEGIFSWEVSGNAYFPASTEHGEFHSTGAALLRPNSHLSEEWQEGICRLAAAAPEMFNALKKCLAFLKRCPMTRNVELEREIETTLNEATNTEITK